MAPIPIMAKGPIFLKYSAMNAIMHITKLFQSMKFSGVARVSAAIPIRPRVAGFRPAKIPWNI